MQRGVQRSHCQASRVFFRPCIHNQESRGVTDEVLGTLMESSIPYSLAEVIEWLTTSIAFSLNPSNWEINAEVQKTLAKEYGIKSCDTTFLLSVVHCTHEKQCRIS